MAAAVLSGGGDVDAALFRQLHQLRERVTALQATHLLVVIDGGGGGGTLVSGGASRVRHVQTASSPDHVGLVGTGRQPAA